MFNAASGLSIRSKVGKFDHSITIIKERDIFYLEVLSLGEEHFPFIVSSKLFNQCFGSTGSAPSTVNTIIFRGHFTTNGSPNNEGCASPGIGVYAIEIHREDYLIGIIRAVIRSKQVFISINQ